MKNEKKIQNEFDIFETSKMKLNFMAICKKRKREETKNNEESFEKKKKNVKIQMKWTCLIIHCLIKMEKSF